MGRGNGCIRGDESGIPTGRRHCGNASTRINRSGNPSLHIVKIVQICLGFRILFEYFVSISQSHGQNGSEQEGNHQKGTKEARLGLVNANTTLVVRGSSSFLPLLFGFLFLPFGSGFFIDIGHLAGLFAGVRLGITIVSRRIVLRTFGLYFRNKFSKY